MQAELKYSFSEIKDSRERCDSEDKSCDGGILAMRIGRGFQVEIVRPCVLIYIWSSTSGLERIYEPEAL